MTYYINLRHSCTCIMFCGNLNAVPCFWKNKGILYILGRCLMQDCVVSLFMCCNDTSVGFRTLPQKRYEKAKDGDVLIIAF